MTQMTCVATMTGPSRSEQLRRGLADFRAGIGNYEIWTSLAWQEIRQRYRRSLLGPFWITLTMLITISGMGPLYSILFKVDPKSFLPYLALGIITWGLISPLILEGCTSFVASDRLIHSLKLPFSTYVMKTVYSNLLTFLHNMLAFIPVMLFFSVEPQWRWLMAIPGVMLILVAGVPTGFILGIFCARFRDLQPIVSSVVQLLFFMTPIFWKASLLGSRNYIVNFNPLYLFIEVVRGPISGYIPGINIYIGTGLVIVALYAFAIPLFAKYRSRIAFWV